MIRAVIFDMDGLMFDTESIWGELWVPCLEPFGIAYPEGLKEAARGTSGESMRKVIRHYCGEECDAEGIRARLYQLAAEQFALGVKKKKGLDELLQYCKRCGYKMAVASSSQRATIEMNLRNNHVEDYFEVIVAGAEVTRSKPDPDIFLTAAHKLGVKPCECVVLEDSFNGVRAGAAGNFITIMVPDLAMPDDEMKSLYTACCEDLLEVKERMENNEF